MTRSERRIYAHGLKLSRIKRNNPQISIKDAYGVCDLTAFNAITGRTNENSLLVKCSTPYKT
jgi:hypothetical protein